MEANILFESFKPVDAISSYVASYWYMDSPPNEGQIQKCFPNGFVDLITVVGGSPNLMWKKGEWTPTPHAMMIGIRTEPVRLRTLHRNIVFGIRLLPEAFIKLLVQPLRELVDNTEDVGDVLGPEFSNLAEKLALAPDNATRVEICNRFFMGLLQKKEQKDHYLAEAVRQAREMGAQASAEALSRKVFIGERQLQRAFLSHLGVTPKRYGRLIRFGQAARMPLKNPDVSWTQISYDCGYADQAHLIREFRSFTGSNPSALLHDPLDMQMIFAAAMG